MYSHGHYIIPVVLILLLGITALTWPLTNVPRIPPFLRSVVGGGERCVSDKDCSSERCCKHEDHPTPKINITLSIKLANGYRTEVQVGNWANESGVAAALTAAGWKDMDYYTILHNGNLISTCVSLAACGVMNGTQLELHVKLEPGPPTLIVSTFLWSGLNSQKKGMMSALWFFTRLPLSLRVTAAFAVPRFHVRLVSPDSPGPWALTDLVSYSRNFSFFFDFDALVAAGATVGVRIIPEVASAFSKTRAEYGGLRVGKVKYEALSEEDTVTRVLEMWRGQGSPKELRLEFPENFVSLNDSSPANRDYLTVLRHTRWHKRFYRIRAQLRMPGTNLGVLRGTYNVAHVRMEDDWPTTYNAHSDRVTRQTEVATGFGRYFASQQVLSGTGLPLIIIMGRSVAISAVNILLRSVPNTTVVLQHDFTAASELIEEYEKAVLGELLGYDAYAFFGSSQSALSFAIYHERVILRGEPKNASIAYISQCDSHCRVRDAEFSPYGTMRR